ncbi:chromatin assembly factor 1 subunit A isoform X2 [Chrysoperla carnea]|uniref:chromatin assembly factor 1 subunit A isoform X2 n=1 Tax=Chrysoperla carnea TaxID=189513 RepID=UPI001D05E0B2|nr:chromatin assembly factor 1 subunit A isoform X2 [Chrysoperla carnea]
MEVIVLDDKEPTKKKLKQSRLPFQSISPKIKLCDPSKKRKLSDTSITEGERAVKQVRCDSKENDSELINVINLSDGEDEPRPANQPDIATFFSSQSKTLKNGKRGEVDKKCEIKISSPIETDLKKPSEINKPKEEIETKTEKTDTVTSDTAVVKECFVDLSSSKVNESEIKSNSGDSDEDLVEMEDSDDEDEEVAEEEDEDQSQTSINGDFNTPSKKDGLISGDDLTPKSTNVNSPLRKLTPRQLQRKLESQKKQEEREKLKLEKLKKLQEEKEEKLRKIQAEKEEKHRQKLEREEQKKKEREEKEEAKKKEREEKERKRLAEIEQKNEEKKQKEEERKKREEEKDAERRKKELETIEKELKKKKAAEAFAKFFVPNTKSETKKSNESLNDTADFNFMPFAVKSDMRMAPHCRVQFTDENKMNLDNKLNSDVDKKELYLNELKNGKPVGKSTRTYEMVSNDQEDEDVVVVDELLDADCIVETAPRPQKMKVKLLQFQENRRPPYWGTWRKKSSEVKARKPLGTDKKIFDYSIDSDDEWEEEEPGESLHGSDDEKDSDCDEKDEYDIDNEFMVPHGYLSDEEVLGEDDEGQTPDSPNAHKVKLKALELEFQAELHEKPERLKPRIFGCLWADKDNNYPKQIPEPIQRYFRIRRILYNNPVILLSEDSEAFVTVKSNNTIRRKKIPEKYFPDLIRLLHGNNNNKVFLYKEFKTFISSIEEDLEISRKSFDVKLKEIAEYKACPDEGPMLNKQCWYVNQEFREKYNKDITLPNYWKYFLTPKRQSIVATNGGDGNTSIAETQPEPKAESKKDFMNLLYLFRQQT